MSEQDLNASSRLEAVLLDKLARQEERICMLEARLEETRREKERQGDRSREQTARTLCGPEDACPQTKPTEYSTRAMSFEASAKPVRAMSFETPVPPVRAMSFKTPAQAQPASETAPPLMAEREPIRLPEFNAPGVDAIAGLVQEKAAERRRPVAAPDVLPQAMLAQPPFAEEAAEPGYERTARLNALLPGRRHSARKEPNYSMFRKAGSVALLSIAVAAMGVGLWQQRQSAFISASTPDTRPIPLLTPPAPLPAPHPFVSSSSSRSLKPLRSARQFTGKPPILEPESETFASPRHEHRIVSRSTATSSGARSHLNSTAPQIASHAFASSAISPARQIEHKQATDTFTRGYKAPPVLRSQLRQAGVSEGNTPPVGSASTSEIARAAERPSVSRSNSEQPSNPDTTSDTPQSFSSPEAPEYRVGESSRRRYSSDARERAEAARRAVGLIPRRRASPPASPEETQTNSEEAPRRQLQGNGRRAMRTLDEMRELLDSIERRKRRQADADSR